jgi:DNA-binding beta-propeller fold protein YncE
VVVSPDSKSVYVTNFRNRNVSQYNVGTGGRLSPKSPAKVAAGFSPLGIVVSPNGHSVYVANGLDGDLSQYNVGAGGKLAPKSPARVAAASDPVAVAASPGGYSVYVTSRAVGHDAHGWIYQFNVGAGGKLSPKTPGRVASADTDPIAVAVSPGGHSVYVPNNVSGNLSQFNVGAGGKLSPKTPAKVATGKSPSQVAVTRP